MTEFDLLTLGETMWRLSPPGRERLETTRALDVHIGGSESNVAIGVARLGKRVAWWSRLPDNPLGRHVAAQIRMHGVDVSGVAWGGTRLGTYFLEFGAAPRATQVYYDRAGSAASEMRPEDFDWSRLRRVRWLHVSGITPALSASCLATVRRAFAEARALGVPISFDLNYRARLWTPLEAADTCHELASQASLVITTERDAHLLYGPRADLDGLHERWPAATIVVTREGRGSAAVDASGIYEAPTYPVEVVDRVGAGDAADAGLLCALLDGKPLREALRWGNAAALLKLTIPGDLAIITRADVEQLLGANPDATIQR